MVLRKYSTGPTSPALKMNLSLPLTLMCFTSKIVILSNLDDSDAINQITNVGLSMTLSINLFLISRQLPFLSTIFIYYLVLSYLSPQPVPSVQPSSLLPCTIIRTMLTVKWPAVFPSIYCPHFCKTIFLSTNINIYSWV